MPLSYLGIPSAKRSQWRRVDEAVVSCYAVTAAIAEGQCLSNLVMPGLLPACVLISLACADDV